MASELAIPKGSLVLVTGANGYIAQHVADQLMYAGYRVRGTSRSEEKAKNIGAIFEKRHGKGVYEYTIVADFAKPGAFNDAMNGVAGVAHVASDLSFSSNPNEVIPPVIEGVKDLLKTAKSHPSVKRVVLTSSSLAAVHPVPNKKFHVTPKDWNETDPKTAWAPPPYEDRGFPVYATSKIDGEKAAWEFVKNEKPQFVLNCVLPNFNIGEKLDPKAPGSTSRWTEAMFKGDKEQTELLRNFPPQFAIDVKDDARLHVAALTHQDVQNERLLGFAEPFNYQSWLDIFKEIDPSKTFPPPLNDDKDLSTYDQERSVELLKRFGRPGWTPLERSVRELLTSVGA